MADAQSERAPETPAEGDPVAFILESQTHCDHYLTPLADPRGKEVLVLGAGAGSDLLWCLRHGARDVVGVDVLKQDPAVLRAALARLGLAPAGSWSLLQLPLEEAGELGRRFDLVLSNNVFEHVRDVRRALEVCAQLVLPGSGRVAVFSAPLYYSSAGSHLPLAPWEHLWAEPGELRHRLVAERRAPPALHALDLRAYLDGEISLNRMRLRDFVAAVDASGLSLLDLQLQPDRALALLPEHLARLAAACPEASPSDFAVEGFAAELALLTAGGAVAGDLRPQAERRHAADRATLLDELARHRAVLAETRSVLAAVESSWAYRLGRLLTAPVRALRGGGSPR